VVVRPNLIGAAAAKAPGQYPFDHFPPLSDYTFTMELVPHVKMPTMHAHGALVGILRIIRKTASAAVGTAGLPIQLTEEGFRVECIGGSDGSDNERKRDKRRNDNFHNETPGLDPDSPPGLSARRAYNFASIL